jgi:ELWxxDGT repeat protein
MAAANRVLFQAANVLYNPILWVSDGTVSGTSQLAASTLSTPIRSSQGYTQLGNRVVFSATDGTHGFELWVTDGFSSGTFMLRDINPGSGDGFSAVAGGGSQTSNGFSNLANGVVIGSNFIFSATNGTGNALWVTDGTTAGTSLFKQIATGGSSYGNASNFTAVGGKVLFHSVDANHNSNLWTTDGTATGTTAVRDLGSSDVPENFGNVSNITALGGTGLAVFLATESTHGKELWVTDGSSAGTSLLVDITPGLSSSDIQNLTPLGNTGKAIFTAVGSTSTNQLWVTDGTTPGTKILQANRGTNGSFFSTINNKALFSTSDGHVWATDGTAAGTVELIASATYSSFYPQYTLGTKAIFSSYTSATLSPTLWATDGTAAGTVHLSSSIIVSFDLTDQGVVLGNKLLFQGKDYGGSQFGNELWGTDGTVAGTGLVANINNNGINSDSNPQNFAVIGNKAVFQANDGQHGAELWSSNGFSASLVKDINSNFAYDSSPSSLSAVTLACFAAGTRIATESGQTPVQNLKVGDRLRLWSGGTRGIVWIGHRSVDIARHPRAHDVTPVRVAPHAFGPGLPHTALRLSPDHAIYSHDVLVPIRHLVNGTTIAREPVVSVTYYHIELDEHDVLMAEGLACESYLDGGDTRDAFEGSAALALHPAFGNPADASPFAPVVSQGVALQNVRALVALHAELLAQSARCA